ncbi:hypothetical protein [Nocardiopsis lucentensis]|uniref:hypothetical protein n=1 Tax=Nocardiopsis lucentensis TaxID=53441 RepID=UPI000364144E|nr:hypothetical protein [Nocardiopsis lucentensis]
MPLSLRVGNHESIREERRLLLTPVYDDARPEQADREATAVAGIFGANASDRSNVLDALDLMRDTVRWSFRENAPGGSTPTAIPRPASARWSDPSSAPEQRHHRVRCGAGHGHRTGRS